MSIRKNRSGQTGQALVEFTWIMLLLIVMAFGLIDFGRFIYQRMVLVNVTREGANLAARATSMTNAMVSVINSSQPLDINARGRVIMTSVLNTGGVCRITAQVSQGGITATSRIGTGVGNIATLPSTPTPIPQMDQTLFVSEVFYTFTPITPIGQLLGFALPSQIYDVAYF